MTYSNEKENHDGRKVLVIVLRPLISGLELILKRETGSVLDSACCCLCAEAKAHEPRFSQSPTFLTSQWRPSDSSQRPGARTVLCPNHGSSHRAAAVVAGRTVAASWADADAGPSGAVSSLGYHLPALQKLR